MATSTTRRTLLKMGVLLLPTPTPLFAAAGQRPVGVVELFTSQGCSRCPPADALFAELAQRDDVIALSYHVDYWDYRGWRDDLATPENTARQRAYGHAFNTTVYTPQAIVNGQQNVVGSSREALYATLEKSSSRTKAMSVDVELSSNEESLVIDIGSNGARPRAAHVLLIYYKPKQLVQISGGENKGKTIDYRNVVTSFQTVGMWHGRPMRLELPRSELERMGGHCATLLQSMDEMGHPGSILGAARMAGDAS